MYRVSKEMRTIVATRLIGLLALLVSMPIYAYNFELDGYDYIKEESVLYKNEVIGIGPNYQENENNYYFNMLKQDFAIDEKGGNISVSALTNMTAFDIWPPEDSWAKLGQLEFFTDLFAVTQHVDVEPFKNKAPSRTTSMYMHDKTITITQYRNIYINESDFSMLRQDSKQLSVYTSDGGNVTWSSSDGQVATVDANGLVKGVGVGTATITATSSNGKYKDSISVTIEKSDFAFTVDGISYYGETDSTIVEVTGISQSLANVTIPESVFYNGISYRVTSIGKFAFYQNKSIISVSIPGTICSIGSSAFEDCTNLTSVSFANGLTSIGSVAFMNCTNLTSITIPNSVKSIGSSAFWECSSLTSVIIPDGVTSIESGVFYHCYHLGSVTIPNSVTSIGDYAFWECQISSLTIPNSVTSIGENAFGDGNLMQSIVSEIMNPFEINENTFNAFNYAYSTLIVPAGTKSLYQSTAGWNKFQNIVEDNSDEANFAINGVTYQGTKSSKTVVVKSVDTSKTWLDIPASVSYDGTAYQVTGITDNAFMGSNMAALVWNVEAALPNNAFNDASIGSNFLLYVKQTSFAPSSIKNVIANSTASSIVLSDDGGRFYCPQAFTARSISYTHNYSMETGGNGKGWETIALPFDVQRIVHNTRGEIVPFPSFNGSSNQKPFWLANFSGNGFRRTAAVLANEPYIIAMPNSSSYRNEYNLAGDVTFSADNVQVPKTPSFSGTFVPAFGTVPQSSTVYALNVNNRHVKYSGNYDAGSRFIANLRDVRPFEAYISNSSTRGIIEISFDDGTTDMLDILLPTDECQEVTIHTLSGQQITRTTQRDFDAVWQQLLKGVYIINGKKWIK